MREYIMLLCLCLGGCAALKQTAKTVNDAATVLCETAFGVEEEAARRGISVEEMCRLHDVLKPFVDEALKAQHAASEKAGISR
jgi:hypothetical protein